MGVPLASILGVSRGPRTAQVADSGAFSAPALVTALIEGPEGIQAQLSEAQRTQLAELAKEGDPDLFWRDLLAFGTLLENAEKFEPALKVYATIVGAVRERPLQSHAQARLDAILGKGGFGGRAEFLLRRFAHDASDPKMIIPMLAGTAVYSLARTAALGRLTAGARGAWYAEGMGARLAASSVGFVAEVPTFALTARALRQIGSNGQNPQPSMAQELGSAAITLGLLKSFSFAGHQAFARLHAANEFGLATRFTGLTKATQPLLSQGAMFTGLLTAHKMEEGIGLRPHVDGATTVTDTLASMFSLGIGARLGHYALGPRFAAFQGEMELRARLSLNQAPSSDSKPSSSLLERPRGLRPAFGNLAAALAGLSVFFPERIAFAQGNPATPPASTSDAVLMTWLSTAVVGGLLLWGGKKIRDHYVAPRGRITELQKFRTQLESAQPESLLKQVKTAERYLREAKGYDRVNDEAIAVEAFNFLGRAIPRLEAKDRLARLEGIWDILTETEIHNNHLALRILRDSVRTLDNPGVERLAFRGRQGLKYEEFDRVLNAVFLLLMLMPQRSPEKRVETAVAIHQALAGRETQINNYVDWMQKGRGTLIGLRDFMDRRQAEEKQKIRQKIRELSKSQEGDGGLDFSAEVRMRRLEKQLEEFTEDPEIDIVNGYLKHLGEKEEEIPLLWGHRYALDFGEKLQGLFHQSEGEAEPAVPLTSLRARIEAARPYLRDGGTWIHRLRPRSLLEEIDRFLDPADRAGEDSSGEH